MQFPTRINVDNDGYILNKITLNKIDSVYEGLLSQVLDILKRCAGEKLHSVYIYGSVGRGEAVLGTSDIDLSVILTSSFSSQEMAHLDDETKMFIRDNPIVPKVDYDIGVTADLFKEDSQYYWGFWLRHVCTCIYGEDLSVHFPKMKPNVHICKALNEDLIDTLTSYREVILKKEASQGTLLSILKRIVRGAYCYVAERDKSWSTNILENLIILQHYFPREEYFKEIECVFLQQKVPTLDDVINYIDYFLNWFNENTIEGE
ncbi:nucleotidyltransferase domain-containing protein [Solibacillus sp. FSL K6-1523]|uniref:nucleotidyltransferase domain-containing protein n=1 Tax=Solibacillus sp. FSL K6-1523 TaxID=2921471 RepID=UPI0030F87EE9